MAEKRIDGMTAIETLLMLHEQYEEEYREGKGEDTDTDKLSDIRAGRQEKGKGATEVTKEIR